jgi:hypothetical protein
MQYNTAELVPIARELFRELHPELQEGGSEEAAFVRGFVQYYVYASGNSLSRTIEWYRAAHARPLRRKMPGVTVIYCCYGISGREYD